VNTLANVLSLAPETLAQSILANLRRMLTGAGISAEVE
jgi:hypothetical protein